MSCAFSPAGYQSHSAGDSASRPPERKRACNRRQIQSGTNKGQNQGLLHTDKVCSCLHICLCLPLSCNCGRTVSAAVKGHSFDQYSFVTQLLGFICRYNLLREDSEGYGKLTTLLGHFGSGDISAAHATAEVWSPPLALIARVGECSSLSTAA